MTNKPDQDYQEAVNWIESLDIPVRRFKSGRIHTVDLRPITESVDDATVERLSGLSKLTELFLSGSRITNEAIISLKQHKSLQTVDIQDTDVDDQAFETLVHMKHLKLLILTGTNVSDEAIQQARKQMINTRIVKL